MLATWILLATALLGGGDVPPFGFSGLEIYKVHHEALGLVTADFNGDGRLDFALANNGRSRLEVFLQKSPEKLRADRARPSRYDEVNEIRDDARFAKELVPLAATVHALVAGDLDGDGAPELAYRAVPDRLVVMKRQGEQWEESQKFKLEEGRGSARSLVAADLNGDGRLDLALLKKAGVALYLQDSQGRLQPPEDFPTGLRDASGLRFTRPGSGPPALVLYRLGFQNGVAVRPVVGGALGPEWHFESGKMSTAYVPPAPEILSVLAVATVSARLQKLTVRTHENPAAVFETPLALYPIGAARGVSEWGLAAGDLNGDGLNDVVVSRPAAAELHVHLQQPDGQFAAPRKSSTFAGTSHLQVGDFDRDGKADVLITSPEEQVVGLASFADGRLTFPRRAAAVAGKPFVAVGTGLLGGEGPDLAVVSKDGSKLVLTVVPEFSGTPISVVCKSVRGDPQRLLAVDLDADGDRDLAVITRRDLGLVLNEGAGKFTALSSTAGGGKWLLQDVKPGAYNTAVLPGGREALLVAKKTIGRALGLDAHRKLVVLEQVNAGEDTKLIGIARSGEAVVVVDEKSSALLVLRRQGSRWRRVQRIDLPSNIVREIHAVALTPGGEPALLVAERSGFLLARRGRTERRLESAWSYETKVKDARLWRVTTGDLNADGRADLVVNDSAKRAFEFLVPPARAGAPVKRALRFEIFEEKHYRERRSGYLRELVAADLTGDGKDDLLVLIHDRVLLYPQE